MYNYHLNKNLTANHRFFIFMSLKQLSTYVVFSTSWYNLSASFFRPNFCSVKAFCAKIGANSCWISSLLIPSSVSVLLQTTEKYCGHKRNAQIRSRKTFQSWISQWLSKILYFESQKQTDCFVEQSEGIVELGTCNQMAGRIEHHLKGLQIGQVHLLRSALGLQPSFDRNQICASNVVELVAVCSNQFS